MKIETTIDAIRAAQLVNDLRAVARRAEPALEAEEHQTISEAADCLERAACIETGEKIMESPTTDTVYRVTRWIDSGGGQAVALAKQEVDRREVAEDGDNR